MSYKYKYTGVMAAGTGSIGGGLTDKITKLLYGVGVRGGGRKSFCRREIGAHGTVWTACLRMQDTTYGISDAKSESRILKCEVWPNSSETADL